MRPDPDNRYIATLNAHVPLPGKIVLEIGCGSGRLTRDIAACAKQVVATDVDASLLEQAQARVTAGNVEFVHTPDGRLRPAAAKFDLVIYTLSLHHIDPERMRTHLLHTGGLLQRRGNIAVLEPGSGGSFLEVKRRFGAGSGDEGPLTAAAAAAMKRLDGWRISVECLFSVDFLFADKADFYRHKLPCYRQLPKEELRDLEAFLDAHTSARGITLSSDRVLTVLQAS